ncbi:MAG: glycosyltransferase [Gemmatimonadota bacterium]
MMNGSKRTPDGAPPIIPEVGILALTGAPSEVNGIMQTRHQLLPRLAHYFPVVWMNPAWEWRVHLANRGNRPDGRRTRRVHAGLDVYEPEWWLPALYRPASLGRWIADQHVARGLKMLARRGCTTTILSVWREQYAREALHFDETVGGLRYYHVDDEYTFSDEERPIPPSEQILLETSNRVFLHSPALVAKKGAINPRTVFSPNGVDYAAFSTPGAEPEDLRSIPHPRIGYTGWLKKQLDFELIEAVAKAAPHLQFVFVGGVVPSHTLENELGRLQALPNVHLLGQKNTTELARYPHHFDVCFLPYARTAYTNYIYPLKLHEFLATGLPVVGTSIRTLQDFGDLIELADDPANVVAAFERSLREAGADSAGREARQEEARRHDWESLAANIALAMAEDLGPTYAERLVAGGVRPSPPPTR